MIRTALILLACTIVPRIALAQSAAPVAPGPASAASPAPQAAAAPATRDLAYGSYQRGLYLAAYREATARLDRDHDDAAAMTLLGELYNQGLGVRQSAKEAAEWYRLAASHGDAHAMASLGLMSIDGRGVPKDDKRGREWLEKAAALKEPTAAYNLALLLLTGSEADRARVPALLKIAVDDEIGDAQYALGSLYARGEVVPEDRTKAAALYQRAALNGSIAGGVEYGIALFNGIGVPSNEVMAARYFKRAAAQGNAIAQNRLARLYATGRGVPRNLIEAAAWHLLASGQGLADEWLDGALKDLPKQDRTRAEQLARERGGQG